MPVHTAGPARWRRDGLALAFFAVVAVVFTFPVGPGAYDDALPGDSGDALLNLWILDWVGHNLGAGWSDLWNTSIFWPNENTLAYSESLIPVAILHRALSAVVGSEVLAFNLIYVAAWTLSGWITYLLARRVTRSTGAAVVAGLIATIATPRLSHYGHFQLAMGFLVPLVVLLLVRFFETPGIGRGALLGFTTGVLTLSTSYYGLMVLVALAVLVPGLVVWLRDREDLERTAIGLVVAAIVGAVIVVPVALQYRDLQQDAHFRRDPEPSGSAHLADFLRVTPDHYLLADLPPFESRSRPESATIENRLYPGLLALALGVVGLVVLVRNRRRLLAQRPVAARAMFLLVPTAVLLLVLAFGDELVVAGRTLWMPYSALRDVPGFSGIRATARFVAFPLLVLALLAALGLGALLARVKRRELRIAIVAVCILAIGAESMMAIDVAETPSDAASRAVNIELARRDPGPVLELPVGSPADGWPWGYIETPRQYLSTIDDQPRVSGYSGFAPPDFDTTARILETFPSDDAFALVDELGVRYVVLRTGVPNGLEEFQEDVVGTDGVGLYSEDSAQAILDALPRERVERVDRFGDAWLIQLRAPITAQQ
jgi:hypothetical protein